MSDFTKRYRGAALITGASAGIGEAFARRLAKEGFELVIVARRKETLDKLADELRTKHNAKVHVVAQDLGDAEGPAAVKRATDALGLKIGFLVNNAGYGSWGKFVKLDLEKEAGMIDLNCRGTMLMAGLYAPEMAERKNGAIIITASTASFQPCPNFATYAATKAFDLSFANALWHELRPKKVDVLAICPGYTKTEFQAVASIDRQFPGPLRTSKQVVDTAMNHLGHGPVAVDGIFNVVGTMLAKLAPRRAVIAAVGSALRR